jgi:MftR C-terminal domain
VASAHRTADVRLGRPPVWSTYAIAPLDGDYENVIAEAFAAARNPDASTDLPARVAAGAAWSATCAARDVWLASNGERDPRKLVNDAFDLIERGLG